MVGADVGDTSVGGADTEEGVGEDLECVVESTTTVANADDAKAGMEAFIDSADATRDKDASVEP